MAELPQPLLEDMLVHHAHPLLVAWRQPRIRWLSCPGHGLLIERFDVFGPGSQILIVWKSVFELMPWARRLAADGEW
ncbi:MAG: hypothetical protein ACJ788_19260 [Ktedonobacteraceae bacterium]